MNGFPVISWDNLLCRELGPAATHSQDAEGYPFANISDWRDYTFWQSSESGELFIKLDASGLPAGAASVDTMVIAGHNLGSAGVSGLSLEWSDDDVNYTPCFPPVDPEDDRTLFRRFGKESRAFFKLRIPAGYSEPPRLGILFLGVSLEIPCWPDPGFDPDAQEAELAAEYGRTGRLLGAAERFRRRKLELSFSRLPPDFIRNEWVPFFKAHGSKPFFFTWDPENRPDQCFLVRFSEVRVSAPFQGGWRSLSFGLQGLAE